MKNTLLLHGVVRSGKGDCAYWIEKLSDHYIRKTGTRLYPGTLNIHLPSGTYPLPKTGVLRLDRAEYGGMVSVSIVPCRILGRQAFLLRTDGDDGKHGDAPESILEIASDIALRSTYGLSDGDIVEVELPV